VKTIGFSDWLKGMRKAMRFGEEAVVPCGDCNVCCMASYLVYIGPNEGNVLAAIPSSFLFPAADLAEGALLLMHDGNGTCPLLIKGNCSAYRNRPRNCRSYDCRVFAATGISPGGDRPLVSERVDGWEFDYPFQTDHDEHKAVKSAACFLLENADCFPEGFVPRAALLQAILAIKVYKPFLGPSNTFCSTEHMGSKYNLSQAIISEERNFSTVPSSESANQ